MAIQLVTDQLSNVLDDTLRSQLVGNFKVIEKALNDLNVKQQNIESDLNNVATSIDAKVKDELLDQNKEIADKLQIQTQQLTERINRIVLGTDHESIRAVMEEMSQDKNSSDDLRTIGTSVNAADYSE